jgi:SNF2 family DNA or RNA helicase
MTASGPAACPLCRAVFRRGDEVSKEELDAAAASQAEADAAAVAGASRAGAGAGAGADDDGDDDGAAILDDAAMAEVPPKVHALLEGLEAMRAEGDYLKAVVFSNFTSFLNIITVHVHAAGWRTSRIDGTLNAGKRKAALERWRRDNADGGAQVLLVSTKSGGVGLNLTHGSYAFMMDLWWNKAVEEQAMDRIHRLGQTRPVRIVRFVTQDSVEEGILAMQESKHAISSGAMAKMTPEQKRTARAESLLQLFKE